MMYKQAIRKKLRFTTPKGMLSAEQLWDLSLADLTTTIKAARKVLKATEAADDLNFLEDSFSAPDPTAQLSFDILKDVYMTKKEENQAKKELLERKAHDQKIMEIIASKKDQALQDKSIQELEQMLSKPATTA